MGQNAIMESNLKKSTKWNIEAIFTQTKNKKGEWTCQRQKKFVAHIFRVSDIRQEEEAVRGKLHLFSWCKFDGKRKRCAHPAFYCLFIEFD
jgi:hypothetical protein